MAWNIGILSPRYLAHSQVFILENKHILNRKKLAKWKALLYLCFYYSFSCLCVISNLLANHDWMAFTCDRDPTYASCMLLHFCNKINYIYQPRFKKKTSCHFGTEKSALSVGTNLTSGITRFRRKTTALLT